MKRKLTCLLIIILLFTQIAYADNAQVCVGLIDTGISSGSIDKSSILPGFNYLDQSTNTEDLIGHGTAVAGIILGSESLYIKGIAPTAEIVPLAIGTKTADGEIIMGDVDILAQAIRDAIDIYDCKIINISSGTCLNTKTLREAVAYAEEKNVILISSVGNDHKFFSKNIYYPAAYDTVIGVSSLKRNGKVSDFSQRNKSVFICAPGEKLKLVSINKGKTTFGDGTSYATAHVSGAVALLVMKYPDLTPKEIRQIISDSADDLGVAGYDTDSGWGALNMNNALNYLQVN